MSQKIALVLPSNPWYCPYVKIYSDILDSIGVQYDIIYWDRYNESKKSDLIYNGKVGSDLKASLPLKLFGYYKYGHFVSNKLKNGNYTKAIIFGPQVGLFCQPFLSKQLKGKYIFDYRDLSIEQKPIFANRLSLLLDDSYANVISSPGFKRCLPDCKKFYLSHNFILEEVKKGLTEHPNNIPTDEIEVLTIGAIRVDANPEIINALGNKFNIHLNFVGRGLGAPVLQKQITEDQINNVSFQGYYDKKDEPDIIKKATFLNIYYPNWISHQTALSNRFYNSLIYRRPMIVTKGQIQGDYCEQYNVGLAVSNCDNLDQKLHQWIQETNFQGYQQRCIELLKVFLDDYDEFKKMLCNFIYESD